jgi:hypothetical protein
MNIAEIKLKGTISKINNLHAETLHGYTNLLMPKMLSLFKSLDSESVGEVIAEHLESVLQRLLRIYGLCYGNVELFQRFLLTKNVSSLKKITDSLIFSFSKIQYIGGSILLDSLLELHMDFFWDCFLNQDDWLLIDRLKKTENTYCNKKTSQFRKAFFLKLKVLHYKNSEALVGVIVNLYRKFIEYSNIFIVFVKLNENDSRESFLEAHYRFMKLNSLSLEIYSLYLDNYVYLRAFSRFLDFSK